MMHDCYKVSKLSMKCLFS